MAARSQFGSSWNMRADVEFAYQAMARDTPSFLKLNLYEVLGGHTRL